MADNILSFSQGVAEEGELSKEAEAAIEKQEALRAYYRKKYQGDEQKAAQQFEERLNRQRIAEQAKQAQERRKQAIELAKETGDMQVAYADAVAKSLKKAASSFASSIKQGYSTATSAVEQGMSVYAEMMGGIEARIQGSNQSFKDMAGDIRKAIGSSRYVKQSEIFTNLQKYVDSGTALNIEQRAFVATVSKTVATTFNAFDETLLRLIRIQEEDSTAARLGMEAALTQSLNSMFQDTSYLNSTSGAVRAALLPALSTMGAQYGTEFEYIAQAYLGSLGSAGVGNTFLTSLATAIGQLASGDVSLFSGDSGVGKLLTMVATRSGVPLGDTLTGGLSQANLARLLQGVVEYGHEIGRSENMLVRSQYASMFGLSMADLAALMNVTSNDLKTISGNILDYQGMMDEANAQLLALGDRLHLSQQISNLMSNTTFSMGYDIASNAGTYATWLIADTLKKTVGGIDIPIPIPTVGIYNVNVADTMKAGLMGYGLLNSLGSILGNVFGTSKLSLDTLRSATVVTRGTGYTNRGGSSLSQSAYIGPGGEDIKGASIAGAKEEEAQQIQGSEPSQTEEIRRILGDTEDESTNTILGILKLINSTISSVITTSGAVNVKFVETGAGGY